MKLAALILAVARSDSTFEPIEVDGRAALKGKCLHCNAPLVVFDDGTPVSAVTLEHLVPKTAGGTDELGNLGLACPRCNHGKGVRHEPTRAPIPELAWVGTGVTRGF